MNLLQFCSSSALSIMLAVHMKRTIKITRKSVDLGNIHVNGLPE
jgi:hypothetical protein